MFFVITGVKMSQINVYIKEYKYLSIPKSRQNCTGNTLIAVHKQLCLR